MARALQKVLERQGLTFSLATAARKVVVRGRPRGRHHRDRRHGHDRACDRVLVAVGRRPYTDGPRPRGARASRSTRAAASPSTHRFETTVPGVYAIGDVIAGPMLAHKAEDEGVACVELHRRPAPAT